MGAAETLALKLARIPLLIGGASPAARRLGPEVGGWLASLSFAAVTVVLLKLSATALVTFRAAVALAMQASCLFAGRRA